MNPLSLLVKSAVETYIKGREIISPFIDLPKEFLNKKSGAFVTIEKNGELRGCIGTYLPVRQNIAEEIIYNAISAATEDYRFSPIQEKELSSLSYIVYILSQPELVKNLKQLNPEKYGIIVKSPYKTGLLLPDLEGIDTAEKQFSLACQKAAIDPLCEKILLYKFAVEKYK